MPRNTVVEGVGYREPTERGGIALIRARRSQSHRHTVLDVVVGEELRAGLI